MKAAQSKKKKKVYSQNDISRNFLIKNVSKNRFYNETDNDL